MIRAFYRGLLGSAPSGKKLVALIVRALISIAIVSLLLWWLPTATLLAAIQSIPKPVWLLVFSGFIVAHSISALKWRLLLRTVKVDMTDSMRFDPSSLAVRQGETIRFVVSNSGKLKHELVLGTEKELKEHYEAMKKNPEMEHADPNMVTLAPGKTGEVVWQFTKAGKVDFACLQPGHYDAGMKGAVNVNKAAEKAAPAADTTKRVFILSSRPG